MTCEVDADAIADCVISTFDQLPEKRKPRPRNDGSREWVPLAGIVLSKSNHPQMHTRRLRDYAHDSVKTESFRAYL